MEDEDDRCDVDHRRHGLDEGRDDQLHARVALEQAQWAQHAKDAQHLVRGGARGLGPEGLGQGASEGEGGRARARVQVSVRARVQVRVRAKVRVRVGARVHLRARASVRVGVRVGVLSGEP